LQEKNAGEKTTTLTLRTDEKQSTGSRNPSERGETKEESGEGKENSKQSLLAQKTPNAKSGPLKHPFQCKVHMMDGSEFTVNLEVSNYTNNC